MSVKKAHDNKLVVIGGGIAGLFSGIITGAPIYEKNSYPGGLLSSYCININTGEKSYCKNKGNDDVLFELGGGHWLWGIDRNMTIYGILTKFSQFKWYQRRSSVYLSDYDLLVPYPLQYHIRHLPKDLRNIALEDVIVARKKLSSFNNYSEITFAEFLKMFFGETLYKVFFEPYNYAYTAGLLYEVAPPRKMKIPDDLELIVRGSREDLQSFIGYNAYFYYPIIGLGPLMWKMSAETKCYLDSRITFVDINRKQLTINDSYNVKYDTLIATIPLLEILKISDMKEFLRDPDPYTSVLCVNAIAKKSRRTPKDHWVYISKSKTGFHRIGYYSNVDKMFLPAKYRSEDYVSVYIEKIFKGGYPQRNLDAETVSILSEATELGFIGEVIAHDFNFVEYAYTWQRPGSAWVDNAVRFLTSSDIMPVGRYAAWGKVEGIVESMEEVLRHVWF